MQNYITSWRKRYAKVLRDYPELKEASSKFVLTAEAASANEQNLQQAITAALICDNSNTYAQRNVMYYSLDNCNTPTDHNYYSNSPIGWALLSMFKWLDSPTLFRIAVEGMEQIYFTL